MTGSSPHPTLAETRAWVAHLHVGQADKSGAPYVGHLERVAAIHARLFPHAPAAERHAAWLHDAIEDTAASADALRRRGYAPEVVAIVEAVTKPDGDTHSYAERIEALIALALVGALRVKIADLSDNLDGGRLAHLTPAFARGARKRYAPARTRLWRALEAHPATR